ncbi:carbon storage regulator [Alloalcanivorax xenomutans]|nr:carbon storage regulator [Alloalcanivorax xenomutans]MCE7525949.1 carbon storage regulator [Alloalcanivorax xenomutans]PHS67261.1 MAG: carbon storage regulator [Alcanivorax sp.]
MLALTRRVGERLVMMDGTVTVNVLEINGDRVVLGLQAPREISIHRLEAYEQ